MGNTTDERKAMIMWKHCVDHTADLDAAAVAFNIHAPVIKINTEVELIALVDDYIGA